jgi:CsoR family transcriptional regulator, copper-sensing transcriptional repressor
VLTQISAVTRALQEVALGLMGDHMRHCVAEASMRGPEQAEEKLAELEVAFRRLLSV